MTDLPEISEADRQFMALHFRERSAGPNSEFERWADMLYPRPKTLYDRALEAYADSIGADVDSLVEAERWGVRYVLRAVKRSLDALDDTPGIAAVLRADIEDMFRGGELDDEVRSPRCPTCRHQVHTKGECLNVASDSDCDCKGGVIRD